MLNAAKVTRWAGWVLGIFLLALASAGCGASPTPTDAPQAAVEPGDLLRRAAERMTQLESAGFILEHQEGSTTLFPGLEMHRAYGVVDLPDRARLTVEGEAAFPRSFVEVKIVTIGDQAYMTNPVTGQWQAWPPEALPFSLTSLGQTVADIIDSMEDATLVGTERLSGHNTYRIKGRTQSQKLSALVPGAGEGFDVGLEVWLEQSEALLIQALIIGQVVITDTAETVRLLTLKDIDLPVDITPPI